MLLCVVFHCRGHILFCAPSFFAMRLDVAVGLAPLPCVEAMPYMQGCHAPIVVVRWSAP
jgi:hypothetical protein